MPGYLPQVGDLIEFKVIGFLDDQTCMNVFHYTVGSRTAGSGGPNLQDCGDKLTEILWDDANGEQQCCTTDFKNVVGFTQVLKPVRTVGVVSIPILHGTGSAIPPTMPTGVSAVIRRKGTLAGRHFQGRLYVPALAVADITGSSILVGGALDNAIQAFMAQILLQVTVIVGGITLIMIPVLVPLPAGTPATPITITIEDYTIRYQRRRELRVGI